MQPDDVIKGSRRGTRAASWHRDNDPDLTTALARWFKNPSQNQTTKFASASQQPLGVSGSPRHWASLAGQRLI